MAKLLGIGIKKKNESWKIIEVRCITSIPEGGKVIRNESRPFYGCLITESFPNGPKCLTPDDIIALAEEVLSINKALESINQ